MRGQRSSVESLPEDFEFEHGANSSNSGMDQQSLWNTMVLDPVQTQTMPEFVLSTGEASISCMNMNNDDASHLSIRSLGGASSSQDQHNNGSLVENKLDHGRREPLRISTEGGPRADERHFESSNMLSVSDANINLNASFVDDGQSFSKSSTFSDMHQNKKYAADMVGTGKEASESNQFHPCSSGHISSSMSSSNPCASSSADVGPMPDDGRVGGSTDGRRLACKRKNVEGFPGQSSSSGNASSSQPVENSLQPCLSYYPLTGYDISGSAVHQPVPNSTEEYPQGLGPVARGMASVCYPSSSTMGNAESSQRNYRMRTNPNQQQDRYSASLWSTAAIRRSHPWQLNQPSQTVMLNQSPESVQGHGSSNAQSQHHTPISGFSQSAYHPPWHGTHPRIVSSSRSFSIDDRMADTRLENNSRNFPVTSHLDLVPAIETQPMVQDPVNWNLSTRDVNIASTSRAGSSSNSPIYPTLGSSWVPYHSPAAQYSRSSSEAVHQAPFASASSDSRSHGMNFPMQRSTHSYNSQELIQLRASLRGLQPAPHVRSAYTVEGQSDGLLGAPLNASSSTAREGRQRMISEIRHALESMRNANVLRFEDMFMIDQTVILAGADLPDRHRDMRLDVDNMSYEELLALGERIGDVSTGLTEEIVSKCLKQKQYVRDSEEIMDEEPCCICLEEYVERENLGMLDCGHDFHSLCIKQWLMQKNLCPICKKTALVT